MRTTLVLEDGVYEAARKIAFDQRRPLGDVVSELAARGLRSQEVAKPVRRHLGFWEGQGHIADDFNDTPQEVLDSMDANL